jgi:hypothetical protein
MCMLTSGHQKGAPDGPLFWLEPPSCRGYVGACETRSYQGAQARAGDKGRLLPLSNSSPPSPSLSSGRKPTVSTPPFLAATATTAQFLRSRDPRLSCATLRQKPKRVLSWNYFAFWFCQILAEAALEIVIQLIPMIYFKKGTSFLCWLEQTTGYHQQLKCDTLMLV